jgi:hypothetical protein
MLARSSDSTEISLDQRVPAPLRLEDVLGRLAHRAMTSLGPW